MKCWTMDFLACEHPLTVFFWCSFLIAAFFRSCFATRFIFWKIILIPALTKNPQKFPLFHGDSWSGHIMSVSLFLCTFTAKSATGFLLTRIPSIPKYYLHAQYIKGQLLHFVSCFLLLNKSFLLVLWFILQIF